MNSLVGYKSNLRELAFIMCGTTLMAIAVNLIYEPMNMVTGGVSGLAIIIKRISLLWLDEGIPVWLSNFVLNIPIFGWAFFVKGRHFVIKTIFANIWFTLAMGLIPVVQITSQDYVIAAVVGGAITGLGLGLVFSTGYSTGGTDMLSSIICHYVPYYSVSRILFVLDAIIISAGAVIFGIRVACYAVIAIFISSRIMDQILSGGKVGKQVYIISDKYNQIGEMIMKHMNRGVTLVEAKGMYTGFNKPMILCVTGRKEIVQLIEIVKGLDEKAFIIISETRQVLGEGFDENS